MVQPANRSLLFRQSLLPFLCLSVFVILVILPKEIVDRHTIRLFYYIAFLMLIRLTFVVRKNKAILGAIPFLFILIFSLYRFGLVKQYSFGADDAYYYSYLPSVFMDHDLEFENQLESMKIPAGLINRKTPLGFTLNEFPAGPAICWAPFFLIGHLTTMCFNLMGSSFPADGISEAYLNAVIAGNFVYAASALILIYLFLIRIFPVFWASVSVAAIWMTTPLYYYANLPFLGSEPLSLMVCSLLFLLSWTVSHRSTRKLAFFTGLAGALAAMIRLQNVIFLLLPFLLILHNSAAKERLIQMVLFLVAFTVGFSPHILLWKCLMGTWLLPAGMFLAYPANPFVLELLFSARNGLFSCSPILAICMIGFLWWTYRSRSWFSALTIVVFLMNVYFNASLIDWWGEVSFGARRFIGCTAIFAAGLAAISTEFSNKLGKKGTVIALLVIPFFFPLNVYMRRAYLRGKIEMTHSVRFSKLLNEKLYFIYKPIVYLCEFPVELYYAFRYGTHLYAPANELFIGEDIFYFERNYGNLLSGVKENPIFGQGWEYPVRKMNEKEACLYIPLHLKQTSIRIAMEMQYRMAVRPSKPFDAKLFLNEKFLRSFRTTDRVHTITVPLHKYDYKNSVNVLKIQSPGPVVLEHLTFLANQ